uniref:E3 ubiquitin-protein ligase APD1-4 middle domain-containing protein n=1 Tax=Strigamia maritima TaxID=126957 RepID=T1JJH7_STRMM
MGQRSKENEVLYTFPVPVSHFLFALNCHGSTKELELQQCLHHSDMTYRVRQLFTLQVTSAMKLSCKAICFIFVAVVIAITLAILMLMAYLAYPGGEMSLSPLDMRVLKGGMSSVWCDGQTTHSSGGTLFNASVVPGNPQTDPNIRRKIMIKENQVPLTPDKSRVFWRYYLSKGSIFDATQCAKTPGVMSFLFRGHDVDENCIRMAFLDEHFEGHNPCTDITIQRYIVRVCRQSMQSMHATITEDDFYLLLYQSSYPDLTYISVNVTLNSPTYDLSNSLANCSSNVKCSLPMRFGKSDTVVAHLFDVTGNDATLKWSCDLRISFYCIVFIGIPVTIFIVASITCKMCCCKRLKKENKPCETAEAIAEPREVDIEKEALLKYSPELTRIDPRLRDMGPIPGPSTLPSAPPLMGATANQPFDEPFQPSGYAEPPPTYEETMRNEVESDEVPTAEKC